MNRYVEALSWYYHRAEHLLFTRRYSLDFDGFIPSDRLVTTSTDSLAHSNNYRPYPNYYLKLLLREALATGIQFANFVDIGCGKGQPCILARRYFRFSNIYGIDFSEPLIEAARRNLVRMGYRNAFFMVADATKWTVPEGNSVLFLFNPFDAVTLGRFLNLNLGHFQRNRSLIAYGYDEHRATLNGLGFEVVSRSDRYRQSIWRYTGSP